ncbi:MAG: penicillin-binding protein 2 [Campylobacteraceae bacterium]|nr:penicillin-binding protein 2 [Campylobacteraceae bacterium]
MKRLNYIIIFIVAVSFMLLARVYFLSIKSNTYYEELSKQNYIKRIYKVPSRGIIQDRNGVALAINNLGFSINIEPHLRSKKSKKRLLKLLALINKHFPKFEKDKLLKKYIKLDSAYRHNYVKLVDYIPYDDFFGKYTVFNATQGLKVESAVKRHYPYKKVASHIIGYVGKASKKDIKKNPMSRYSGIIGKNGLEKYYNEKLQGKLGFKDVKVNALNKEIEVLDEKNVSLNNNIQISIDIKLQAYVHELFGDQSGSIIVMNVNNGEILAAGSFPEFDNNIFVGGISYKEWDILKNDFNHPFTNKIVNGLYPPGSIWKMGVALSFLENGVSPGYTVYDEGFVTLGNRNFRCWKEHGHGKVNFRKSLRESCDVFYYKGSQKIGIDKISATMKKFGFGAQTGIDQINEFVGNNPNKEWKSKRYNRSWVKGETLISSIGQGYTLTTPIQVARYTAYLATGKLPKPHLNKNNYEEPIEIPMNESYLKMVRRGMYDVANHKLGTAYWHTRSSKVKMAAKTGTAQVVSIPQSEKKRMKESELAYFHRSHAWLTSYAPFKNPKYSITLIVEHGGHGGSAGGKIVSKIYNRMIELGYLKAD